jgi:hypothetical protein
LLGGDYTIQIPEVFAIEFPPLVELHMEAYYEAEEFQAKFNTREVL